MLAMREAHGRDLTAHELIRIDELNARNFGVVEEPMAYKGTMSRDSASPVPLSASRE